MAARKIPRNPAGFPCRLADKPKGRPSSAETNVAGSRLPIRALAASTASTWRQPSLQRFSPKWLCPSALQRCRDRHGVQLLQILAGKPQLSSPNETPPLRHASTRRVHARRDDSHSHSSGFRTLKSSKLLRQYGWNRSVPAAELYHSGSVECVRDVTKTHYAAPTLMSARGWAGTPCHGHCSNAAADAVCTASSADRNLRAGPISEAKTRRDADR